MNNLEDQINWTRINNDVNGNHRYVCHYLTFNTHTTVSYEQALVMAKQLGGKRFHNKKYDGGIVFQSYNIQDITRQILILTGQARECSRKTTPGEIYRGYGATHYKTFLDKDIRNKQGAIKKWFKCPIDGLNYSTK